MKYKNGQAQALVRSMSVSSWYKARALWCSPRGGGDKIDSRRLHLGHASALWSTPERARWSSVSKAAKSIHTPIFGSIPHPLPRSRQCRCVRVSVIRRTRDCQVTFSPRPFRNNVDSPGLARRALPRGSDDPFAASPEERRQRPRTTEGRVCSGRSAAETSSNKLGERQVMRVRIRGT